MFYSRRHELQRNERKLLLQALTGRTFYFRHTKLHKFAVDKKLQQMAFDLTLISAVRDRLRLIYDSKVFFIAFDAPRETFSYDFVLFLSPKDEQERVQKKTFVNWINSYLAKRNPPMRIEELFYDLRDGTKLIALLEILSGDRLPVEKGRNMKRPHFLSNANTALQFLASKRIKLVNINSADLVDGKPAVVLGLIWTIILYFQVSFCGFPSFSRY